MEREVMILVDGKEVPLNDFVEEITENVVRALVSPLKGVNPDGEITIKIGPKEEEK